MLEGVCLKNCQQSNIIPSHTFLAVIVFDDSIKLSQNNNLTAHIIVKAKSHVDTHVCIP